MTPTLNHAHQATYEAILRHPSAHNLQWRDVRSMLGALAEVVDGPNGKVKATRNGKTITLHPDHQKDIATEGQLRDLRAFLETTGEGLTSSVAGGVNLLVVIDHRQACVYKTELRGSVPERIVPYDPDNDGRYLHHTENDSSGQRRPEQKGYYEAIARSLQGAEQILVFGGGTGASSAMEQLLSELALHHKDIAARIVGSVVVDEHHLTEDQLLAKAREFYAQAATHDRSIQEPHHVGAEKGTIHMT
jgi:hypothetical protein